MGDKTKIEWADATWNPIRARWTGAPDGVEPPIGGHCEHVSEGCRNCYAETMNRRLGTRLDFKPGNLAALASFVDENLLLIPLRWKRARTIFVGSMTDVFGRWVTDEQLDRIFGVMSLCPQHIFLLLTKRPERMRDYLTTCPPAMRARAMQLAVKDLMAFAEPGITLPLPNVWLGTSVEDQAAADARIPELRATPAAKRFLSCEPLLGPLTFRWAKWHDYRSDQAAGRSISELDGMRGLDWVIAGGESGPGARPMHPTWARALREQCAAAGVPFHFKQWGEWAPQGSDAEYQQHGVERTRFFTNYDHAFARVGKKAAGRLLDGVTHDGVPG